MNFETKKIISGKCFNHLKISCKTSRSLFGLILVTCSEYIKIEFRLLKWFHQENRVFKDFKYLLTNVKNCDFVTLSQLLIVYFCKSQKVAKLFKLGLELVIKCSSQ